jgi:dynein assembly factor with WDR repeat domains 1
MKLKRFLLRYYPPGAWPARLLMVRMFFDGGVVIGVMLEYVKRDGTEEMKEIDLLHLTAE